MTDTDTEALAKDLAIKLAVSNMDKAKAYHWAPNRKIAADAAVKNLLIGLGCEAVVRAWEECS